MDSIKDERQNSVIIQLKDNMPRSTAMAKNRVQAKHERLIKSANDLQAALTSFNLSVNNIRIENNKTELERFLAGLHRAYQAISSHLKAFKKTYTLPYRRRFKKWYSQIQPGELERLDEYLKLLHELHLPDSHTSANTYLSIPQIEQTLQTAIISITNKIESANIANPFTIPSHAESDAIILWDQKHKYWIKFIQQKTRFDQHIILARYIDDHWQLIPKNSQVDFYGDQVEYKYYPEATTKFYMQINLDQEKQINLTQEYPHLRASQKWNFTNQTWQAIQPSWQFENLAMHMVYSIEDECFVSFNIDFANGFQPVIQEQLENGEWREVTNLTEYLETRRFCPCHTQDADQQFHIRFIDNGANSEFIKIPLDYANRNSDTTRASAINNLVDIARERRARLASGLHQLTQETKYITNRRYTQAEKPKSKSEPVNATQEYSLRSIFDLLSGRREKTKAEIRFFESINPANWDYSWLQPKWAQDAIDRVSSAWHSMAPAPKSNQAKMEDLIQLSKNEDVVSSWAKIMQRTSIENELKLMKFKAVSLNRKMDQLNIEAEIVEIQKSLDQLFLSLFDQKDLPDEIHLSYEGRRKVKAWSECLDTIDYKIGQIQIVLNKAQKLIQEFNNYLGIPEIAGYTTTEAQLKETLANLINNTLFNRLGDLQRNIARNLNHKLSAIRTIAEEIDNSEKAYFHNTDKLEDADTSTYAILSPEWPSNTAPLEHHTPNEVTYIETNDTIEIPENLNTTKSKRDLKEAAVFIAIQARENWCKGEDYFDFTENESDPLSAKLSFYVIEAFQQLNQLNPDSEQIEDEDIIFDRDNQYKPKTSSTYKEKICNILAKQNFYRTNNAKVTLQERLQDVPTEKILLPEEPPRAGKK